MDWWRDPQLLPEVTQCHTDRLQHRGTCKRQAVHITSWKPGYVVDRVFFVASNVKNDKWYRGPHQLDSTDQSDAMRWEEFKKKERTTSCVLIDGAGFCEIQCVVSEHLLKVIRDNQNAWENKKIKQNKKIKTATGSLINSLMCVNIFLNVILSGHDRHRITASNNLEQLVVSNSTFLWQAQLPAAINEFKHKRAIHDSSSHIFDRFKGTSTCITKLSISELKLCRVKDD